MIWGYVLTVYKKSTPPAPPKSESAADKGSPKT